MSDKRDREPYKLILIDGYSLIHRAYFALPPLTASDGTPTGAVYGFCNMLWRLIEDEKPDGIAVAYDMSGETFRHKMFEDYKGHRPKMPDDLRSQIKLLREVLQAIDLPIYEALGYEADDIIGTLARESADAGKRVLIVTGDRDTLQLIGPRTEVLLTRRGITDMERFDVEAILERYGLPPEKLIDVKALMGDSSDNIPGVPGVGEKTALKLIQQFGSLEELYERLDEVRGKKLPQSLAEYKEQAYLSRRLATIDQHSPVEFREEEFRWNGVNLSAVEPLFRKLGFRNLLQRMAAAAGDGNSATGEAAKAQAVEENVPQLHWKVLPPDVEIPLGVEIRALAGVEGTNALPLTNGFALAEQDSGMFWCRLGREGEKDGKQYLRRLFTKFLGDDEAAPTRLDGNAQSVTDPAVRAVALEDLKGWLRAVFHESEGPRCLPGIDDKPFFDVRLAAYLLDPSRTSYPLDQLVEQYLGKSIPSQEAVFGKGRQQKQLDDIPREELACFLQIRAECLSELGDALRSELEGRGLTDLYEKVEMPLTLVLADMELCGMLVDRDVLDELDREFVERIQVLSEEITDLAGESFNINSTQQLGQILFEKLQLPVVKKTKTGYSTDAEVLEQLADQHPLPAKVLQYRQLVKLHSTYVEGLRAQIHPDTGRVHGRFLQTIAATGRLSSIEPNLQNIPIREDDGRRLRKAFVAPPGYKLLTADYSQIELRILAHMSKDPGLIEAFQQGRDIHTATAAEVFDVEPEDVTPLMRSQAKAVNFGIIYGISDFGLARNLNLTRAKAKSFIERYFERYPGVKKYLDGAVEQAREQGYVRTLLNRIRYLPEIKSRNYARRQFAERTAMNTPIQGTAADMIKKAMVHVARRLRRERLESRIILQVHDELMFEVPENELQTVSALVREEMEQAMELLVPVVVEVKAGDNWFDMEEIARGV